MSGSFPKKGMVLSLGSINADFQMRTPRTPEVSETLLASHFVRLSGGKAANVAYIAAKLELPTQLFGHVGDDDLSEQALQPLREININLAGVRKIQAAHTGVTMITVPNDGKKSIVMAANANMLWEVDDCHPVINAVNDSPFQTVLVVDCEIPVRVVEKAMRATRETGRVVILDPSPADKVTETLLSLTDFITPNTGEAKVLTGVDIQDISTAISAGRLLIERGVRVACMKLFDGGCILVEKERCFQIKAFPQKVVDTTGAGDAFAGGLAVALAEGKSNIEAVRFAVATSHLAVTEYGSQPAYPERSCIEDMERRLEICTHEQKKN